MQQGNDHWGKRQKPSYGETPKAYNPNLDMINLSMTKVNNQRSYSLLVVKSYKIIETTWSCFLPGGTILVAQNRKQPWNQDLFDVDSESASLTNDAAAILHTFVRVCIHHKKSETRYSSCNWILDNTSVQAYQTRLEYTGSNDEVSEINERRSSNFGHGSYHSDTSLAVHENVRSHADVPR